MNLSFYTPIAYDFKYALESIKSYYTIADEIILGLDKDFISWSNKKFEFDEELFSNEIKNIDIDKKIIIYKDNFHLLRMPLENETLERNYLLKKCKNNYVIGIDSDEILLNSLEFKNWFDNFKNIIFDIECIFFTVYKEIENKLLITKPYESAVIGTNKNSNYKKCRITGNKKIMAPLKILHYSWGRTPEEIKQKLENWGHSRDFDIKRHFSIWNNVSLENYKEKKFLHPLKLKQWWKELELIDNNLNFNKS